MRAGAAKVEITPDRPVWMDGMPRCHPSIGVHDSLFARALILTNSNSPASGIAIISADVCAVGDDLALACRNACSTAIGIPVTSIIVAATHTHAGPATFGFFSVREETYNKHLAASIARAVVSAASDLQPAVVSCGTGQEETISHYRRLMARDGRVVMNWEAYPAELLLGPLGNIDPEVGVLRLSSAADHQRTIAILYNYAGHPNTLSGDNYLLSAEYPGVAERLLEQKWGGVATFLNGAQGSVDVDGLRDRDWEEMERLGTVLATITTEALRESRPSVAPVLHKATRRYTLPRRQVTDDEWLWAQATLRKTGGHAVAMPDGVSENFKALVLQEMRATTADIIVEQTCFSVGDCAFITFPGELYTEIGQQIKAASPFSRTFIIGLANGYIGYVPTAKAIGEGGYAEDIRRVDAAAEEVVCRESASLLQRVFKMHKR